MSEVHDSGNKAQMRLQMPDSRHAPCPIGFSGMTIPSYLHDDCDSRFHV